MLSSPPNYEQSVGDNVSEKKEQKSEGGARGLCPHGADLATHCPACDYVGCPEDPASRALVPFIFICTPQEVSQGVRQDSCENDYTAFWEHDELIIINKETQDLYLVISYENLRNGSSRPYYTWYAEDLKKVKDPADEDYMRSISS